ncbi:MAG: aspartyl protease family protein [Sphingomicrobium sp.]
MIEGTVNGHPTEMMLDSGAGMTVLDRAFADSIGVKGSTAIQVQGAAGTVPGQIATGVDLAVGTLRLSKASVLILDMAPIAKGVGHPITAVLGKEAFAAGAVTIDFPNSRIRFSDRNSFKAPDGATRLAMGDRGVISTVKVAIGDLAPIDADLDLGNGGTLILSKAYWTAQPTIAKLRQAESQSGGVGGLKLARRATLPVVSLAEHRFVEVPATLNDDPTALPITGANVGIELLKSFVVTVDSSAKALYLSGGQAGKVRKERAGVRFEWAGDRLDVVYASPDGPGAKAGLKRGDQVVSVDGRRVGADYYGRPDWIYGDAGGSVKLRLADGRQVSVVLADYY